MTPTTKKAAAAAAVVLGLAAVGWAVSRPPHDEVASFAADEPAAVTGLAVSADGRQFATTAGDKLVRLWDAGSYRQVRALTGHAAATTAVAFRPDGRRLASGSVDRTVKVWDAATGEGTATLTGFAGAVTAVAFGPDGRLAAGDAKGNVRLWPPDGPADAGVPLAGGRADVVGLAFVDGGNTLVGVGCDKVARYWDAATGRPAGEFRFAAGTGGHLKGFSVTADGVTAVTTVLGRVVVLDLASKREKAAVRPTAGVLHGAAITTDGGRLAIASEGRGLVVWDPQASADLGVLRGHVSFARVVAAVPGGRRVVTGGTDGSIKVWDLP